MVKWNIICWNCYKMPFGQNVDTKICIKMFVFLWPSGKFWNAFFNFWLLQMELLGNVKANEDNLFWFWKKLMITAIFMGYNITNPSSYLFTWMNEFVLFAFLLFTANKTNLFVCFLGESMARRICFWFYLTFRWSNAR